MYLPRLPISSFLKNPNMDTIFYARIQAVRIKELGLFIAHTATLRWLRGISQLVTTIMDRRKRGSSRLIPTTKYMKDAAITAMTRRTLTMRPKRRGTQAVSTMMYYWDGSQGTDSMRQNEEEGWFELPTIILLSVRHIFASIPIYVGVSSGRIKNHMQKWTTDPITRNISFFIAFQQDSPQTWSSNKTTFFLLSRGGDHHAVMTNDFDPSFSSSRITQADWFCMTTRTVTSKFKVSASRQATELMGWYQRLKPNQPPPPSHWLPFTPI